MSIRETVLRPQPRFDIKWLKTNLESLFYGETNLINCWNSLIIDGELTGHFSVGLLNSAGVTAKQGEFGKYYCGQRVNTIKFKSICAHFPIVGVDLHLL